MVIAAFACFSLLIIGWFVAPCSAKAELPKASTKPTDMTAIVTP